MRPLLINSNSAEFVECKTEEMLVKLAVEQPNKFCLDAHGRWHCPPGEEAAKKYGIGYRVFSTEEIDRTFYRNIVFLEDYLLNDVQDIAKIVIDRLTELVSSEEGLNLSTLLALAEKIGATADDVYQLIADGLLYTDLRREALVNRSRVFVYTSQQVASTKKNLASYPKAMFVDLKIGERIQWGNNLFEIVNLDQDNVWLIGEMNNLPTVSLEHFEQLVKKGEIAAVPNTEKPSSALPWEELCNKAAPKERQEAQRRFDILMKHYQKIPLSQNVSQRTLARWSGYYKRAELLYGNGLIGLIPKWAERGDRSTQRLNPIVLNLMNELIENDYERNVQSSMFVVYGKLRLACKEISEKPPSYMTFVRHIQKRPLHKQELKRKGSRAAYNSEPLYFFLEKDTPRHGDRPFEACHIDHTLLNIESRDSVTGQNFGRPWATFLVDAFSRRILVAYLSYESPSYRTCMMVMRDCVRRFGRLPQTVVVDKGSNFKSTYFECFAAEFRIVIKRRPTAKARFGSIIENLFNVAHEEFIYNLTGNTQLSWEDVRQVTPSHNPRNLALWPIGDLYERFCNWAYERYDTAEHWTLKQSPRALYVNTIRLTGERRHRLITYNENFRILTLPTTSKGTAKNIQNKGLKVNGEYYFNPALEKRELLEVQLPVRYDPYNYSIVRAYVGTEWVTCLSQDYEQVKNLTEAEMRIRSAEKSRRNTMFWRRSSERAEQRARGAIEDQEHEVELSKHLAVLRGQQLEDRKIRQIIDEEVTWQLDGEQPMAMLPQHKTDVPKHSSRFSLVEGNDVETLEDYV
jgi:putative transposase